MKRNIVVSLPYKFTLLSNKVPDYEQLRFVSLPYKFTLLSNDATPAQLEEAVSLPYKFTLLSNLKFEKTTCYRCELYRVYLKLT